MHVLLLQIMPCFYGSSPFRAFGLIRSRSRLDPAEPKLVPIKVPGCVCEGKRTHLMHTHKRQEELLLRRRWQWMGLHRGEGVCAALRGRKNKNSLQQLLARAQSPRAALSHRIISLRENRPSRNTHARRRLVCKFVYRICLFSPPWSELGN